MFVIKCRSNYVIIKSHGKNMIHKFLHNSSFLVRVMYYFLVSHKEFKTEKIPQPTCNSKTKLLLYLFQCIRNTKNIIQTYESNDFKFSIISRVYYI